MKFLKKFISIFNKLFYQMEKENGVIDVPFSYEEYDHEYFDSLAKDFSKYGLNGDGFLNKKEFVLWSTDRGTDKKVAKHLFYVADFNNDGILSLDEFRHFALIQQEMIVQDEVHKYARMIYTSVRSRCNYPGGLKRKEFLKFMELMNTPVGFFERKKIFKQYDTDKDGTVDFNEIMARIYFKQRRLLNTQN